MTAIKLLNAESAMTDKLARHIALVSQETILFSASLEENILLGRKDISPESVSLWPIVFQPPGIQSGFSWLETAASKRTAIMRR